MKNLRRRAGGRLYWHWDPQIVQTSSRLEPADLMQPLLDAARGVRIPTLLVRGLLSDIVTNAGVAELHEILPNFEVYDVANAGHMVAGDRNDAFSKAIIDFLRRHAPL
jgi:pimeloyl-ACP methyl ester carboxylesterase